MYLSCSSPPDSAPHRDEREAAQSGQPSSAPARGRERYGKNGMNGKVLVVLFAFALFGVGIVVVGLSWIAFRLMDV